MTDFVFVLFAEDPDMFTQWLGLGYLISMLKSIKDININVKTYNHNEVKKAVSEIADINPRFIGISILQHNYESSIEFIKLFGLYKKNNHIVLGNIESTLFAELLLNDYPQIDSVAMGEGEITLTELCKRVINGQSLKGCLGVYYREGGSIYKNEPRELIENLDDLPFPDKTYINREKTMHDVIGSRGCAGNCSFCVDNAAFRGQPGKKIRLRSIKNIVDEIEYLINNCNCKYVKLYDSTFCAGSLDADVRLEELYDEMKSRNLWVLIMMHLRCEQVNQKTVLILTKLKEVGVFCFFVGIESGNDKDLILYRKIAKVEDNKRAVKTFHDNDISYIYGFINFNPYSTIDSLKDNIKFLDENHVRFTFGHLSKRLLVYSGSSMTQKLFNDGLLKQDISKPILDQYGYRFVHDHIEKIYNVTQHCCDIFGDDMYELMTMLYVQFIHVYSEDSKEFQSLSDFKKNYNDYMNDVTIATSNIYKLILSKAEDNEETLIRIADEKIKIYEKLLSEKKKTTMDQLKTIYKYLKAKDELLML